MLNRFPDKEGLRDFIQDSLPNISIEKLEFTLKIVDAYLNHAPLTLVGLDLLITLLNAAEQAPQLVSEYEEVKNKLDLMWAEFEQKERRYHELSDQRDEELQKRKKNEKNAFSVGIQGIPANEDPVDIVVIQQQIDALTAEAPVLRTKLQELQQKLSDIEAKITRLGHNGQFDQEEFSLANSPIINDALLRAILGEFGRDDLEEMFGNQFSIAADFQQKIGGGTPESPSEDNGNLGDNEDGSLDENPIVSTTANEASENPFSGKKIREGVHRFHSWNELFNRTEEAESLDKDDSLPLKVRQVLTMLRQNEDFNQEVMSRFPTAEGKPNKKLNPFDQVLFATTLTMEELKDIFSKKSITSFATTLFLMYRSFFPESGYFNPEEFEPLALSLVDNEAEIANGVKLSLIDNPNDPYSVLEAWWIYREN